MSAERPTLPGRGRAADPVPPAPPESRPPAAGRLTRARGQLDQPDRPTTARASRPASRGTSRPTPTWPTPTSTRPRTRRRGGSALGAAVFALIALAVLAFLLTGISPLHVSGASVAAAAGPVASCDTTVDIVGTVATNGEAGVLTYQWLRSDGQVSAELNQTVAEGSTTTQVHLMWTFTGAGTYRANATLRVLRPDPVDAVGHFTYQCTAIPGRTR